MKNYAIKDLPLLRVHGRTQLCPEGLPLFWTGSGIEMNIIAPSLSLTYKADYGIFEPWVDVLIDGVRTQRVMLRKGVHELPIYRGGEMALGEASPLRRVRILRDTPAMPADEENCLLFLSLSFEGELLPLKEPRGRLLFIGDSITSGEGGCGAVSSMTWDSGCFDAVDNYAPFTADALGADYQVLSQSGWGVYCDYLGNTDAVLPPFEGQVCGLLKGEKARALGAFAPWKASLFVPDAVIINLGTNDLSGILAMRDRDGSRKEFEELPEELPVSGREKVSESVTRFLLHLRSRYPEAFLVWCYGMLKTEPPIFYQQMEETLKGAVKAFQEETGDQKSAYLTLPPTEASEFGSRYHPGHLSHLHAAERLIAFLRERGIGKN